MDVPHVTVVVPALNEEGSIENTLDNINFSLSTVGIAFEIIVVDDGSSDNTYDRAVSRASRVIRHESPRGYGASLLEGITAAKYEWIAITDADGTYPVERLSDLIAVAREGFSLVIASRRKSMLPDSALKGIIRSMFGVIVEFAAGRRLPDVNSGLRLFERDLVVGDSFPYCKGFSFTTTLSILTALSNRKIAFVPIDYNKRTGTSKIKFLRDGLRAAGIVLKILVCRSPLKTVPLVVGLVGIVLLLGVLMPPFSPVLAHYAPPILWIAMGLIIAGAVLIGVLLALRRPAEMRCENADVPK